jgi:hypothetical protein
MWLRYWDTRQAHGEPRVIGVRRVLDPSGVQQSFVLFESESASLGSRGHSTWGMPRSSDGSIRELPHRLNRSKAAAQGNRSGKLLVSLRRHCLHYATSQMSWPIPGHKHAATTLPRMHAGITCSLLAHQSDPCIVMRLALAF